MLRLAKNFDHRCPVPFIALCEFFTHPAAHQCFKLSIIIYVHSLYQRALAIVKDVCVQIPQE